VSNIELFRQMIAGEVPGAAVSRLIGMEMVEVGEGTATFELVAGPQHWSPPGNLHGGILCDVADAAMGIAFASTLAPEESFTTLELKINFLRPFWKGLLTAEGEVASRGRTIGLVHCKVTDEKKRLIASSTSPSLMPRHSWPR